MTKFARGLLGAGALLAAAVGTVTAPEAPAAGETGDRIARGKALAESLCARCHAVGPAGASPHPITPTFRELARQRPIAMLEAAAETGVIAGHDEMPEFRLPDDDLAALTAYIASLGGG